MKTGRRVPNPAAKELAGTFRKDRHADIVQLAQPPRNEPVAPAYLTVEAKAVWAEELRRVVACGAVEADSSLFACYCSEEARYRCSVIANEDIKIAQITELRRMRELLGIAGQRSRLARSSSASGTDTKPSPFAPRK